MAYVSPVHSQDTCMSQHAVILLIHGCIIIVAVLVVPGVRHGGVSWPDSSWWRQLSDYPCTASHNRNVGSWSDTASTVVQATGGQHDAQCHPAGPHICCSRKQVILRCGTPAVCSLKIQSCIVLFFPSAVMLVNQSRLLGQQLRSTLTERNRNMVSKQLKWKPLDDNDLRSMRFGLRQMGKQTGFLEPKVRCLYTFDEPFFIEAIFHTQRFVFTECLIYWNFVLF